MRPDFWVVQTFNGLSYGALLFLLASGLSLIFGVMRIVNMAHGSYFMLGGYLGLTVALRTRSFAMSVVAATVAIALIGMAMERFFLRRLRGQDLGQVLMTIGFALIFQDLALLIWGGDPYNLPVPAALSGGLRVGGAVFPIYRIFIVGVAVAVGLGLWLLLDRTRAGAMIRAAVDDGEMAQGVGINVPRISLAVFGLGAALAALGGVIGAGFLGVYPGADFEVLPYAFVVVIVGGLGSLPGRDGGQPARGPPRQFRQGALPRAGLLHAVRAHGAHPRHPPHRALRPGLMPSARAHA